MLSHVYVYGLIVTLDCNMATLAYCKESIGIENVYGLKIYGHMLNLYHMNLEKYHFSG